MNIQIVELNSSPSSLEINHDEGTVSFVNGDYSLDVVSIETLIEAADILKELS